MQGVKNGTAVLMGYKRDGLNKGDATFQERLVGEGVSFKASLHLGQQPTALLPSPTSTPPQPQWPDKSKMIALV